MAERLVAGKLRELIGGWCVWHTINISLLLAYTDTVYMQCFFVQIVPMTEPYSEFV